LRNFISDIQNKISSLKPGSINVLILSFDFNVAKGIASQSRKEYRDRSLPKLHLSLTEVIQAESESVQGNILDEAREIFRTESWPKIEDGSESCLKPQTPKNPLNSDDGQSSYKNKAESILDSVKAAIFHQDSQQLDWFG
jgi:hypothetical protein